MPGRNHILERARERLLSVLAHEPPRWFVVDVVSQELLLVSRDTVADRWRVSTAAAGLDAREGSGGTPPGVHRISRKIGADQPVGAVFASREPTGDTWHAGSPSAEGLDLIVSRILTLEGLEDGVNRGSGVDSESRYIYLHGTNHESELGRPVSHGCIRLGSRDVLEVFDAAVVGDPLVIL
ncbi:MAG: L,D-transpeptidase [Candidatus Krumholzibacteriia bacterium]